MPSMTMPLTVRYSGLDPGRDRSIELVSASIGAVVDLGRTLTIFRLVYPDDLERRPHDPAMLIDRARARWDRARNSWHEMAT